MTICLTSSRIPCVDIITISKIWRKLPKHYYLIPYYIYSILKFFIETIGWDASIRWRCSKYDKQFHGLSRDIWSWKSCFVYRQMMNLLILCQGYCPTLNFLYPTSLTFPHKKPLLGRGVGLYQPHQPIQIDKSP